MSSSTASASVSSSSSISFAEVTRQVQAVQQDHSLDYHQQEEHIRRIIELDNMHHGDLAHFLLAHASAADTTAEVFGSCLQTLEAYSRLYPDVLLSAHLAPLAQQPLMKHTDVSKHFLQLVKIGMKLVPKEQYTTETSSSLARYCLHVLTQADLVRAESANTLLETLVPLNYGTNLTWIHEYCQEFRTNATILLRLFSLVMKVSQGSDDVLNLCGQIGIVGDISRLCRDTDDLLLQINLMELFVELSNSVAGLEYLCSDGVVAWLISVGCGSADRAADPILESEALRVLTSIFAHASLHSFQFVEKIGAESVKNFLDAVHRQLDEGDEQSRLSALGVVSDFASISAASLMLVVMHHNGKLMSAWLEFMNSSKPDLQSAALTALAKIFDQEDQHYVDNERRGQFGANLSTVFQFPGSDAITIDRIIELKQNLLRSLGQVKNVSPSHLLLRLAKQPIPSLRHAAKHLMRAVATQATGWGLQAMFNTTGHLHDAHVIQSEFWQYLKDRFTESSREGKEYKFAIIEAIARCPARALLHEDIGRELDVMVGQGPFYMPPRVKDMETL